MMESVRGFDVAMDDAPACVVGDRGEIHLNTKPETDPAALFAVLKRFLPWLRRVGHEAGSLSPWLHPELLILGLPALCLETQHLRAALLVRRIETDAADPHGIAHITGTGCFRHARVKPESCYRMRLLLTHRRNLKREFLDFGNAIRQSLKVVGVKLGGMSRGGFDKAVREAVVDDPLTSELMDAMLSARVVLCKEYYRLHDLIMKLAAHSAFCRCFTAISSVGAVMALCFTTAVANPSRFRRSRDVAPNFGLMSRQWQPGTSIDVLGRIPKTGRPDVRRALRSVIGLMTRFKSQDKVKSWNQQIAKRACHRETVVVLVRKPAVIMHAMWSDGTLYVCDPAASEADIDDRADVKHRKLLGAHR